MVNEPPTPDNQGTGVDGADRRGGHWTPVADVDADLLANCQTPQDFALAMGAWYILIREASYRRTLTFNLADGLLAKRLCVSINTARKATRLLEGVGLLKSRSGFVAGTKNREPLTRTLNPSVLPWKTSLKPYANIEQPPYSNIEQPLCNGIGKSFAETLTEPSKGSSKKGHVADRALPLSANRGSAGGSPMPRKPEKPAAPAPKVAAPLPPPVAEPPPRVVTERGRLPGTSAMRFRKFSDGTTEMDWLGNNFNGEESIP